MSFQFKMHVMWKTTTSFYKTTIKLAIKLTIYKIHCHLIEWRSYNTAAWSILPACRVFVFTVWINKNKIYLSKMKKVNRARYLQVHLYLLGLYRRGSKICLAFNEGARTNAVNQGHECTKLCEIMICTRSVLKNKAVLS